MKNSWYPIIDIMNPSELKVLSCFDEEVEILRRFGSSMVNLEKLELPERFMDDDQQEL